MLPSGWMKRYPRLGMRPVAGTIRRWWQSQPAARRRGLVMSYPHYLYLQPAARPDVSVYYNIDDYTLYWPESADEVRELERAAVLAADLTVCVSRLRADELDRRDPGSGRANSPRAPWHPDAVSGRRSRSSGRPSRPLTWRAFRGPISAMSAPSRTGSIGSFWTSSAATFRKPRS